MRHAWLPLLLAFLPLAPAVGQSPGRDASVFVNAVTLEAEDQIARFHEPVCPISLGLPADYNAVVVERLRAVATAARIPVAANTDCRPNIVVMVADSGAEVTSRLREVRPDVFGGLLSVDIDRLLARTGPVRSWQRSETVRALGMPIVERRDGYLHQDVHLWHGEEAGLLRRSTRRELRLSVVLFDVDAIDGLTLMQLADHAAMRGLAPTRPDGTVRSRSILELFEDRAGGRGPTPSVTDIDVAYLGALYRSPAAGTAAFQRDAMARLIERDLRPDN